MDQRLGPLGCDIFTLAFNTLFVFCAVGFAGKLVVFTKGKIQKLLQ
jgi:hypothetical protein